MLRETFPVLVVERLPVACRYLAQKYFFMRVVTVRVPPSLWMEA